MEILYILNNEIEKVNNIFIYGTGEFSIDVMTYLLQLEVSIKGFIYDDIYDVRERIFNKKVIGISELKSLEDVVIIIPSIYSEKEYNYLKEQGFTKVYWSQLYKKTFVDMADVNINKAFIINKKFLNKKNKIVFGAGVSGKKYLKLIEQNGIKVDAYGDSNQMKWGSKIEDVDVISISQICKYGDTAGIVIPPAYTTDIYNNLNKKQQNNCFLSPSKYGLYIENSNKLEELLDIGVIQKIIDHSKGKKVIVYGTDNVALRISEILKEFSIEVDYFIGEETSTNDKLKVNNKYHLLLENLEELLIVIPDIQKKIYQEKVESIKELSNLVKYITVGNSDGRTCQFIDIDLGYNALMDVMGYKVFKRIANNKEKTYRIITLGNSTTYAEYKWTIKSWSEQLFEKICEITNINIEVICGGINSYSSHDELIKLIRDGVILKPDMVISYSGVNDMGFIEGIEGYPHLRPARKEQFQRINKIYVKKDENKIRDTVSYGIESSKKDYEYWIDNMRMMHAICKEFNIKFYSFLQPTILCKEYQLSQSEQYIFKEAFKEDRAIEILQYANEFYINATEKIKEFDYIIDFTNIFNGKTGLFFDPVHLNTTGNKIVAEKIYSIIW